MAGVKEKGESSERIKNLHESAPGLSAKIATEEARRCPQCADPTCQQGCPLKIDIRGFIRFLREGNTQAALEKIKEQNGMPSICGRICSAPCEVTCVLNEEHSPIDIRSLERFASDHGRQRFAKVGSPVRAGKKIAIVGSGPAGLTAAAELAKRNYQVTIFESMDQPGGVLRYGIPEFRIPKKILDEEITHIKNLGVEIKTNCFIGQTVTIPELFAQKFVSVLLTTGAGVPKFMDLKGANLGCVYYGEEFLMRINLMKANFFAKYIPAFLIGKRVAVIGSGNTAVDCARAARRLGRQVTLVFRRTEDEMRVRKDVAQSAKDEGVKFEALTKPVEILANERNFVSGLRCVHMDYAEGSDKNKWELEEVPGSEFVVECDTVIIAIGHRPNSFIYRSSPQIKLNLDGSIWTDENSGMTSMDHVFAAGNVATNAGAVVQAMASGKKAAQKIHEYLGKK